MKLIFFALIVELVSKIDGDLVALRLCRAQVGEPETNGRRSFQLLSGRGFEIPAGLVFLALGFEAIFRLENPPFSALAINPQHLFAVDDNQTTSLLGVFAGGDLIRGPSKVLDVVRDARRAPRGIEAYLASARGPRSSAVGTAKGDCNR